jgi:hypothetical protein
LDPARGGIFEPLPADVDAYSYVMSANIHRRHLTIEQKRELIGKLLKAQPKQSNRQIAVKLTSPI